MSAISASKLLAESHNLSDVALTYVCPRVLAVVDIIYCDSDLFPPLGSA